MQFSLPEGLEWSSVDIFDDNVLQKVYELLRDHYVEDPDELFRFHYQFDFLKWALRIPNAKSEWHMAIKRKDGGQMVAFIAASPVRLCVKEKYLHAFTNI